MTTALSEQYPPSGEWTTDDLDELPEDGRRYELIDGVPIVSPSPTHRHQKTSSRLEFRLEPTCPPELAVVQGVEVRVNWRRSLTPDLLVVTAEAAAREPSKFQPHDVVLAVEVVSPSTITMDRITKPALYAKAGVPFFWRVETQAGIVVHTHRRDPEAEVYVPTGQFDDVIEVDEPWRIRLPISEITPPYYKAEG